MKDSQAPPDVDWFFKTNLDSDADWYDVDWYDADSTMEDDNLVGGKEPIWAKLADSAASPSSSCFMTLQRHEGQLASLSAPDNVVVQTPGHGMPAFLIVLRGYPCSGGLVDAGLRVYFVMVGV